MIRENSKQAMKGSSLLPGCFYVDKDKIKENLIKKRGFVLKVE